MKPSIPKGTRDFGPKEMARRNYIFNTIKSVFMKYGYSPIETPAMENLSTLMGKYGEEGDKLLFKILNSGEFIENVDLSQFEKGKVAFMDEASVEAQGTAISNFITTKGKPLSNSARLSNMISEKGLRYDLTVPFARFVVQHQNDIVFPFKRYQIQPVWRADRPQKGRYREFFQCDVDVIGSDSLLNELELVQITDSVFTTLGIDVKIKINNRKILSGISELIGRPDKLIDITIAIDKIDKIGMDEVKQELLRCGLDSEAIDIIEPILLLEGGISDKLEIMRTILHSSETGQKGIAELEKVFDLISSSNIRQEVELDLSLARGLNYYTGAIFEVEAKNIEIGSICGGGRYDDLTGIFGLSGVSGVGISFGADRIYDVLLSLDKYPLDSVEGTKVLIANLGDKYIDYIIPIAGQLRDNGIITEIYPDVSRLKKQFEYAYKRSIPYIVIVGEEEISKKVVSIKDLRSGEQKIASPVEILSIIS